MTTTKSLEELLSEAAAAEQTATAARAEAEAVAARLAQEREARLDTFDTATLAGYPDDEQRLADAEREAYEAFRRAVLDTPLVAAYAAYRAARITRAMMRSEVAACAARTGAPWRVADLSYAAPGLVDSLEDFAEREAGGIASDRVESWRDTREAAGDGPEENPDAAA